MFNFSIDVNFSQIVLSLSNVFRELGAWSVSEAWHLCLAIIVGALVVTAIVLKLGNWAARVYIEHKKKTVVKEEWGSWRASGFHKEAVHALAYCSVTLIILKVGFEFGRACGVTVPVAHEIAANAIAVIILLTYALRQLKERHKGELKNLAIRFLSCTASTLVLMHHSDLIRRYAGPATIYALDVIPL